MATDQPRRAVVTLVHGTWARNAGWPKEGSILRREVTAALGAGTTFRRFRWSGRNRHRARLGAARELQAYLRQGFELHPDAEHFIIAHSHGGNVVTYALADPQIRNRLAGVVSLATPFIQVEADESRMEVVPGFWASLGAAYLVTLVIIRGGLWFLAWLFSFTLPESVDLVLIPVVLLLGVILYFMWRSIQGGRGETRRREVVAACAQPALDGPPFLCVRIGIDEAAIGIRSANALATPDQSLADPLDRVMGIGEYLLMAGVPLTLVLIGTGSVWWGSRVATAVMLIAIVFWGFPYFLRRQLANSAPFSRMVQNLAVGPERMTDALLVRTRTSVAPRVARPDLIEAFVIPRSRTVRRWLQTHRAATLRHSLPYTHPDSLAAVGAWLARRMRAKREQSSTETAGTSGAAV